MSTNGILYLKKDRDKPVLRFHPWIFSGAVKDIDGNPASGETVEVRNEKGEFLALAAFSPESQIRARIWSWDPDHEINEGHFHQNLTQSIQFRKQLGLDFQALRLVYAESDSLPGLIVDQYGDLLVVQFLSAGAEYWRSTIVNLLVELTGANTIYERSDVEVRKLEGLPLQKGLLYGPEPEPLITIQEQNLTYVVDIINGHKTGFYLDQRGNRGIAKELSQEKQVLDCFCYTGGFSINALAGQAQSVTMVDVSADALALAKKNLEMNRFSGAKAELIQGDVFEVLRRYRDRNQQFDLIILDPPKFAPTASHAQQAARGYKDINLLAMKLLNPGGRLLTFSCSGGIDEDFFLRILSGAARDAGVDARIIKKMWQSADHSINLRFPEGSYLKGFVIHVS